MAFNWNNLQYLIPGYGGAKLAWDVGSKIYNTYKQYNQPSQSSSSSPGSSTPTSTSQPFDIEAYRRELDAKYPVINYISQAPQLPEYKPMNYSWEQARSEAAPSVNTYYDKTLQDYLKTVETRKARTQEDLATQMGQYGTQEKYLGEDYSTRLANLATGAKLSGQAEAQSATANRAGLKTGLASAGLTFSGLGNEQLNQQDVARRLSLAAATAQLEQEKAAAETTKVRGTEAIGTGKKAAKTAATRAQEDLMTEQEQKRQDLEYQRAADIATKASQLYSQQQAAWEAANPYWANMLGG